MPLLGATQDENAAGSAVRSRLGYEADTLRIGFPPTYVGGYASHFQESVERGSRSCVR